MSDSYNYRGQIGLAVLVLGGMLLAALSLITRETISKPGYVVPAPQPFPTGYGFPALQHPTSRTVGLRQKTFHGVDSCNMSKINGKEFDRRVSVVRGQAIGVGGWLADRINSDVPDKAWIILASDNQHGTFQVPVPYRTRRPDVQEALGGDRAYAYSGFISNIASGKLPPGSYHLYLVFKGESLFYTCDNGHHLSIVFPNQASAPVTSGIHP